MSGPISYLEALNYLKKNNIGNLKKKLYCFSSCELIQLEIYIKGNFAKLGIEIELEKLDFGTLKQFLLTKNKKIIDDQVCFLLFPWDFIEAFNWRTGYIVPTKKLIHYKNEINQIYDLLADKFHFKNASFLYLECAVPEIFRNNEDKKVLLELIKIAAHNLSAEFISNKYFSLSNYVNSGLPIKNKEIANLAWMIVRISQRKFESKKIIILDLDNTLWRGVLGEDGIKGINAGQDDLGYFFFIFQTFLKNLKDNGILLAVVSKNDQDIIEEAFKLNKFPLDQNDFIKLIGTYEPKSMQIEKLLSTINLTPEACLFVDDNELELQEVKDNLQDVTCELLINNLDYLPNFLNKLKTYFHFSTLTSEDINRTNFYKNKLENFSTVRGKGGNIDTYLKSLETKLIFKEGNKNNIERSLQLINKTNQFNLNGIRRNLDDLLAFMSEGKQIFIGELSDINGMHGEVLVLIIDKYGVILNLVMSCRVFQRKAEYAFLYCLKDFGFTKIKFEYIKTKRNTPFLKFAKSVALEIDKNIFTINQDKFEYLYSEFKNIVRIEKEEC